MRTLLTRWVRLARRVITYSHSILLSMLLSPTRVLSPDGCRHVTITRSVQTGNRYSVVEVLKGRIFTNRVDNISITSSRSLVPLVSWQYLNGRVLPDQENFFLQRRIRPIKMPRHVPGVVVSLLTGGGGNYNYGHWLLDCLPRLHLAKERISSHGSVKYLIPDDALQFQRETLDALGIKVEARISSRDCQYLSPDRLIATSHPIPNHSCIPEWIAEFLRASFLSHASDSAFGEFVYISRSDSVNSRRLVNEDYLCSLLKSVGFNSYRLSELSVADKIALFSHAKMIVGVHGAGLTNLVFASYGTVVYELFSSVHRPVMYESISRLVGLDYRNVVCDEFDDRESPMKADFRISDSDAMSILRHAEQVASSLSPGGAPSS